MKVVVCIASHHRHEPLAIVLKCLPQDWIAVVVISDRSDLDHIPDRPNTEVYIHPNEPLGAKWQYAVDMAKTYGPDLLVITGSDDVIVSSTEALVKSVSDADMIGLRSFMAFDGVQHYRCGYRSRTKMPIGGGRVYTKRILDIMRWNLFDRTRSKHLDERGWENGRRVGAKAVAEDTFEGFELIALKGSWPQMNSLDKYKKSTTVYVEPLPEMEPLGPYQFDPCAV